jgi:GST-like protein
MIDLYYWPTPNGHKITLMLEECGLPYTLKPVNITKGEQLAPDFLAISPNNKMPAIVDHDPGDGSGPISVFESGAILLYLARKARKFAGDTLHERVKVKEWLFWQVGGLGPMAGQLGHFAQFAAEKIPYAIQRYTDETRRLLGVMDHRLTACEFLACHNYSVADMASYPWVKPAIAIAGAEEFPNLRRWLATIAARPATARAYARADDITRS